MKITNFYVTIEVAPRDGYSESLQCCTDRNDTSKLKFTFPYGEITPEQAAAVAEFSKTITDAFNVLQSQVNRVNKKLQLEEYAPIVPPAAGTAGSDFDLDANPAVAQSSHGVSEVTDNCLLTMETAKDDEEKLQAMLASGLKEEALEERETGSDKA